MSNIVLEQVGLFSVWILGVTVGFTACTASCLPFMGSWVMSRNLGMKGSLVDAGLFAFGKVSAYATLGAFAGITGEFLLHYLRSGVGNILIGSTSILAGVWLIYNMGKQHRGCGISKRHNLHPFMLGFSLSFIPCAPLAALLAACAAAGSFTLGMSYGFVFGLGAAITPLFIILPLLGKLGQELRSRNPWLKKWLVLFGSSVLVAIGCYRIAMAF
jgi:cytochrome c-type biogenesis protein